MGKLGSIIGVLGGVMGRIRDEFAVSNTVAPQLVGDDSSGFAAAHVEQSLEEAHCCLPISAIL